MANVDDPATVLVSIGTTSWVIGEIVSSEIKTTDVDGEKEDERVYLWQKSNNGADEWSGADGTNNESTYTIHSNMAGRWIRLMVTTTDNYGGAGVGISSSEKILVSEYEYIEDFSSAEEGQSMSGLNSYLFNGGSIEGGAKVTLSGDGVGKNGGFKSDGPGPSTSKYLRFTEGNPRYLQTGNIRTILGIIQSLVLWYIKGNSTNGGEMTDIDENLVLNVLDASKNSIETIDIEHGVAAGA